ncbi:pyridoxal-phosphate-dependent aminotransferase family protein [Haloimpatiens lingqiaonensis]|uniref:pyridoxal-phosphate-dependent aminotransferase family protein n=1 Tax=Haloimpatiens lingqiaonensis TaxID=1380675 RepID=UPI0010FF5878|nr:alanine--glyoxylate aminotransferase family protein [Haloimpatiens lingqiaonensis]
MQETLIMTPGPTYVHEDVRRALMKPITNPDLDLNFYEFYRGLCDKIKRFLNTENEVLVLCGEGILGLEAACASLIEPGDKVLCIHNGIFGKGFGDFAKMYGGDVVYYEGDYKSGIKYQELEEFLKNNNDFKVATLVHCETPSGITNDVEKLCPLLKKYGIITVVDSVAGMGGEEFKVDEWNIDIALGGSQKCISASPGLTLLSISSDAWNKIKNRKSPIVGFYANLNNWSTWYEDKWFPYTQPISDLYALDVAFDRMLKDKNMIERHKDIAHRVRHSLIEGGLELYPLDSFSNTVTTINIPEGITYKEIYEDMLNKHNIMIAGAFDFLKDKVIRIGHMGENCYEEKLYLTLKALNSVLKEHNIDLKKDLHQSFVLD